MVKQWLLKLCSGLFGLSLSFAETNTAHDFIFQQPNGNVIKLADYKNKVILVTNIASECGMIKQIGELQQLWDQYRDQGLIVIGVPSNDFGNQEPLDGEQVIQFCSRTFKANFIIVDKCHLKGNKMHPFYRWARNHFGVISHPRWNYHKYLINRRGQLIDWFSSVTSPLSLADKIKQELEK